MTNPNPEPSLHWLRCFSAPLVSQKPGDQESEPVHGRFTRYSQPSGSRRTGSTRGSWISVRKVIA